MTANRTSGLLFDADTPALAGATVLEFAVLGSSSAGNSSVLRLSSAHASRQIIIDGGLSPRATRGYLSALGFSYDRRSALHSL